MTAEISNVIRPIYYFGEDALTGVVHGFANIDLSLPFFCFTDAPQTAIAAWNLYLVYTSTFNNDIYANLYDVLQALNYNCNPTSLGGIFSGLILYFAPTIKAWLYYNNSEWLYIPLFALFGMQWFNDISLTYDTWSQKFSAHFDIMNGGYILGKFLSSGLLFAAFIEFLTEFQVPQPKIDGKIIRTV